LLSRGIGTDCRQSTTVRTCAKRACPGALCPELV
jgi:hypothetical protein